MQREPTGREVAVSVAVFGAEVEKEIDRSPTLRHLLDNADEQERSAILALGRVNPFKPEDIAPLQSKLLAARLIKEWLNAAVLAGRNAAQLLAEEEGLILTPETPSGHVDA